MMKGQTFKMVCQLPYFDKPKLKIGPASLKSALLGNFNKVKLIILISSCSKWGYGRNGVFILLRLPDRPTHIALEV